MKNIFFLIVFFTVLGCAEENTGTTPLTYDHFKRNISADMSYSAIVEFFGEPTKDIGSGIHIYVYDLSDSTEIWIGYTDEIMYTWHVDEQGNLLHTII